MPGETHRLASTTRDAIKPVLGRSGRAVGATDYRPPDPDPGRHRVLPLLRARSRARVPGGRRGGAAPLERALDPRRGRARRLLPDAQGVGHAALTPAGRAAR